MKPIYQILYEMGAGSASTAVTTQAVARACDRLVTSNGEKRRLVYTELSRSQLVRRVDLKTEYATDANGWYTVWEPPT